MALLTDRKFIHFNRKSDFEAQLNANTISDKQIVFLKDAQEIWTHGTYYGSVEQFLDETNKDSTNAISAAAVYQALADDEEVIAAALNDLNDRIENLELSTNYEPSSLDNEDLELAAGDTYEEAFGKLEKSINDNEQITAAALTDLDSRINTLHLPQSLDDIPDGSTRKLATKQDTLVSGTNIKTINNESILGSGNITIQGGGGDTNVIETIKVNNVALTPDANKAVNIPITNEKYGNGYAIQTDNGQSQTVTASLTDYVLTTNGRVSVKFTHDAPYGPSLNINNTGAKGIRDKNNMPLTYDAIYEGDIATFIYDGQYYILVDVKHEYNYESYLDPDPLRMTLTQDENESNIQICSFTRDGKTFGSIIFSQLDKILYQDITFTNPYLVNEQSGLQEWIFSAVANSSSGDPVILLLRIFNQWDPTYMGGEERIYIDTDISGLDIIEVVDLGGSGGPIVDITQQASSAQDLSSFLDNLPTGYYKNSDGMVMPEDIFYKNGDKITFIPSGIEYSYDYNNGYNFENATAPTDHPILMGIPTYEQYAEDDTNEEYPNYGLEKTLLNLDYLELPGNCDMFVSYIPPVGSTSTMLIGVLSSLDPISMYPDKIVDVCLLEIKTTGTIQNYMYQYDYQIQVTEYLLGANQKRSRNYTWSTTGDCNEIDFRNISWTNGGYFALGSNMVNGIPLSTPKAYYYGTSSTAAATVQKEVSIPSITELNAGQVIIIKPTVTSTVASSTLKLNDFAAYPMRYNNAAITTSTDSVVWNSAFPSWWLFDGTYWVFVGHGIDSNTTYSGMTQAEVTAGSSTTNRLISPKLLRDNFYTETECDTNFAKAPLVIEVDYGDTSVTSGTFDSITSALAAGREVIVKYDAGDQNYILPFLKYDGSDEVYYSFTALDSDAFGAYRAPHVHIYEEDSIEISYTQFSVSDHSHGSITSAGTITSDTSVANGDKLVITDNSDNSKVKRSGISFDGSTTTKALTPKGTWETFLQSAPVTSVNNQTGAVTLALGDTNVIETIKVDGVALTPDANKAVDIISSLPEYDYSDIDTLTTKGVYKINHQVTESTPTIENPSIDSKYLLIVGSITTPISTGGGVIGPQIRTRCIQTLYKYGDEILARGKDIPSGTWSQWVNIHSEMQDNIDYLMDAVNTVYVTITRSGTSPNYTYTADKTYQDIYDAIDAGSRVIVLYDGYYNGGALQMPLLVADTDYYLFATTVLNYNQDGLPVYIYFTIYEQSITYDESPSIESAISTATRGKYTKPIGGIPKTDLASAVQTSLGKADTALQSFTETDPVFSASAAAGITSANITNWNNSKVHVYTIPSTGVYVKNIANNTVLTGITDSALTADITSEIIPMLQFVIYEDEEVEYFYLDYATPGLEYHFKSITEDYVHSIVLTPGTSDSIKITNNTITYLCKRVTMNGSNKTVSSAGTIALGTVITSETSLSKGTTSGSGNAVTDISVSGHEITLTKGSTFLTSHQSIKTINNQTLTGTGNITINELPTVTSADNGKILMVVNGAWALVSPTTIYTGSSTPASGTGNNGDIYLQTS